MVQPTGPAPTTACTAAVWDAPWSATEFSAHTALDEDGYELADGHTLEVREVAAHSGTDRFGRDHTTHAMDKRSVKYSTSLV